MSDDEAKKGLVVPFGKYKGQPVEVLANDPEYCEWMTAQPWFREKHANVYNVIINNFGDPSETPEHNALQARFLDDEFRLKFASVAIPRLWWYVNTSGEISQKASGWVASQIVSFREKEAKRKVDLEALKWGGKFSPYKEDWDVDDAGVVIGAPKFEVGGVDVAFKVWAGISLKGRIWSQELPRFFIDRPLHVEIKPEIGDDYPAILRQMRRNGSTYIFTRRYIGEGVDESTFIQFMDSQKIRVIFENEVNSVQKIAIDEFNSDVFSQLVKSKVEKNLSPFGPLSSPSIPKNGDSATNEPQ